MAEKVKKPRKKKVLIPLPEGIQVGDMVSYYLRGWHVGHLKGVKGNDVMIIPIGAYGSDTQKRSKLVPIVDIKKIDK